MSRTIVGIAARAIAARAILPPTPAAFLAIFTTWTVKLVVSARRAVEPLFC